MGGPKKEDPGEISDAASENGDESDNALTDHDKMGNSADGSGPCKKKYDAKDPNRPRRKKARRACYACQRAHLTCGDERPCQRCIKRGLADACQDGVRKKAKYLHDAPAEALGPVLGPSWDPRNSVGTSAPGMHRPSIQRQSSSASERAMSTPSSNLFSQTPAPSFPVYSGTGQQQSGGVPDTMGFNPQASPVSPSFAGASAQGPQMGNPMLSGPGTTDLNALFDPSNPALYNFDLEGLNFGSQYAGWEFGILNKMAVGADTPPRENSLSQTPTSEQPPYAALFGNGASNGRSFDNGSSHNTSIFGGDFAMMDQNSTMYSQGNLQHGLPHAYAIAAGPTSLASPSTEATASPQPGVHMDGSPKPGMFGNLGGPGAHGVSGQHKAKPRFIKGGASALTKPSRDSARIYESVKEPYPYTTGFHNMISILRARLPVDKLLKIAMALGEIRPSFIACTKDLAREDLIFMEKCFQRTLVEFDDFLHNCAAPTVVCRRSGEVVAVNKEFTALTGWTSSVLLGREPNRNVYIPSASTSTDGSDGRASATPPRKRPDLETAPDQLAPVFLAELLDDDSVVEFYHDFSSLAFEDSRGRVQRSGRLMKYRTQEMLDAAAAKSNLAPGSAGANGEGRPASAIHRTGSAGVLSNRVTRIDGEMGVAQIERDGRVNCTYCWTIKRDVFDIPMMIIINFLPRFYPNEEPQAV